ncbi:MAG: hypothetical protein WBO36_15460 [Saprospiraceae bacterium]
MNTINYHNKKFKPVINSENGIVDDSMTFHYLQHGKVLTCSYSGQHIVAGHLIGLVDDYGQIDMRYHQVNQALELMTGICISTPSISAEGKIMLSESWQWTSGDQSIGHSTLIEI